MRTPFDEFAGGELTERFANRSARNVEGLGQTFFVEPGRNSPEMIFSEICRRTWSDRVSGCWSSSSSRTGTLAVAALAMWAS
jgi:hypothetical protein